MTKKSPEKPAKPQIRNCFSPKNPVYARAGEHSRTKQSFKKQTDLNYLMDRYQKTGQLPPTNKGTPAYGYAPGVDFQEALQLIEQAEKSFLELPQAVRDNFDGDPQKFMNFVQNPENQPRFAEMGLTESQGSTTEPDQATVTSTRSVTVPTDTKPQIGESNETQKDG